MDAQNGIAGKILWVNLSNGEFKEEEPVAEIYRSYLGGYGLGVYYIYTRIKPKCNPLGSDNILGFCPGLFTGSMAPFTGRWMVCGKSPLTGKGITTDGSQCNGGWGDSNCGGYFGPAIRRAGYDAIFFTGISKKPVYLLIDGQKKELCDAAELWGKDTTTTEQLLKTKHGKAMQVASIGVSGENLSLISGIVNDRGRIAARSGLGAVMGSKKLKALCLNGTFKIKNADTKKAAELSTNYRKMIEKRFKSKIGGFVSKMIPSLSSAIRLLKIPMVSPEFLFTKAYHEFGTGFSTPISAETGDMPIKNFNGVGYRDFPSKISRQFSSQHLDKFKKSGYGCFGCPLQCGAIYSIPEWGLEETHRPEYETLGSFGGMVLNPDIKTMLQINEYLNREGMDAISAGGTVAFVHECVEKGILKKEDFKCHEFPDGFLPNWNTSETLLPLLKLMVTREGIGNVLADGNLIAATTIGKGAEQCAMNANGQEIPMHDARNMKSLVLTYMVDPTPGRHTAAGIDFAFLGMVNHLVKGLTFENSKDIILKAKYQSKYAKFKQSFNALGFCEFSTWQGTYPLLELIQAIFGWDCSLDEILQIGWRIQSLRQMFNAREGAIHHELPGRLYGNPPIEKGPLKNISIAGEDMAQSYYQAMGYQDNGVPMEGTLKELKLDFCIKDLAQSKGRPKPLQNSSVNEKLNSEKSPVDSLPSNNSAILHVNLSGYFETKPLNEEITLEFSELPSIKQILDALNKKLNMVIFSSDSIKNNRITIMLNGQRIESERIKDQKVNTSDVISVLQPMVGG